jgi:putative endonuclease
MNQPLPFCVYVLQSTKDDGLYIGFTTDLARRLDDHNAGKSPSTAPRTPFELVFCEFYRARADAVRRETYLKSSAGRRTLKIMLQESLVAGMNATNPAACAFTAASTSS